MGPENTLTLSTLLLTLVIEQASALANDPFIHVHYFLGVCFVPGAPLHRTDEYIWTCMNW